MVISDKILKEFGSYYSGITSVQQLVFLDIFEYIWIQHYWSFIRLVFAYLLILPFTTTNRNKQSKGMTFWYIWYVILGQSPWFSISHGCHWEFDIYSGCDHCTVYEYTVSVPWSCTIQWMYHTVCIIVKYLLYVTVCSVL